MLKSILSALTLAWIAAFLFAGLPVRAEERIVAIGTGGLTGVYYPTGGAICRLVNKDRASHNLRCFVESTDGSINNIERLRTGDLDIAVVQSDWQFHAYRGTSVFAGEPPFKNLRALFSVHPEPFTVVARADSGIRTFDDLAGKRVNVGNPGSGQRATMEVVMAAKGWTMKDFAEVSELPSAEQSEALCGNRIDAMVFTVGHPAGSIQEATTACDSVIVDVTGPAIDRLVADNPYYWNAVIPGNTYRNNPNDVHTFGVGATVLTTTRMSADDIYAITQSVFKNINEFKQLHPAFAVIDAKKMIQEGLSIPLHDGAIRYYRERNLM